MKNIKFLALVVAVMVITLLSVSGAWAGPVGQTTPTGTGSAGTGGPGGVALLPPYVPPGANPPGDPPPGHLALSAVGFQPVVGNTPTQVCFPAASVPTQVIRYWSIDHSQWVSLTTTVSGGLACATITSPANVQLQT